MDRTPRSAMPARLLRLLTLLQSRPQWSADELCRRLEITDRTLRRDLHRLRSLDYEVRGVPGRAGGYRLEPGHNLPPLTLDDDEAVAVSVALGGLGVQAPALADGAERARVKLDQVLPAPLRTRAAAVRTSVTLGSDGQRPPDIDPALLIVIGECCRDHRRLSFDYVDRQGGTTWRHVEPHRIVTVRVHGYWYLIAWDRDREDWRTFRIDRIRRPRPSLDRFTPRDLDATAHLQRSFAAAEYEHVAVLRVGLPAEQVRQRIWGPLPGSITPTGQHSCDVRLTADSVDLVVQYAAAVLALDAPVDLVAAGPVADRLRRFTPAAEAPSATSCPGS